MLTVDESEVRVGLDQLLDSVESGEEVGITRHGRLIARMLPARGNRHENSESYRPSMPNFRARLEEDFPNGPMSDDFVSKGIIKDREERAI